MCLDPTQHPQWIRSKEGRHATILAALRLRTAKEYPSVNVNFAPLNHVWGRIGMEQQLLLIWVLCAHRVLLPEE